MNNKLLVRLSNIIGVASIVLLVYWVFTFISITVFGFKVFKENLTEIFYLSIVGILALMLGALIINIMFNLTRIAEKHNKDIVSNSQVFSKRLGTFFLLSFPLIFGILFVGDYLTSSKKEKMLIASAKSIIENNHYKTKQLVNYSFDKEWIINTNDILDIFSKTDKHFPNVSVIVMDSLDKANVFLSFDDYYQLRNDTLPLEKKNFIQQTTKEERDYLTKIFINNSKEIRFSAHDGRYELFYPHIEKDKKIVLYFSDYQRYGKFGR